MHKHHLLSSCFMALMTFAANTSWSASNFIISTAPGTTLPTTVSAGSTVQAYFLVTNETHSTRRGYVVTGLPATVTQNTSNSHCPNPITLAAQSSCTLQLDITGEAKGNFALCRGSSCTSSAQPLNVSLTGSTINAWIAVGGYFAGSNLAYPLIAASQNGASGWTYVVNRTTPTLPANYLAVRKTPFNSSSCAGMYCIAAGAYGDSSVNYPFIASSSDYGSTWSYPSLTLPPSYVDGDGFNNSSCSSSACIAVGAYTNGSVNYPLGFTSSDHGATWTYTIFNTPSSLPSDYSDNGFLAGASCTGTVCVAAGRYSTVSTGYPMALSSSNGGQSWTVTLSSGTPALPGDYSDRGTFLNVSCNGSNCVAAGYYNSTTATFPLAATSTNSGQSWTYTLTSSAPTLPSDYDQSSQSTKGFSSVSCSTTSCVAVGSYSSTDTFNYPLAATSLDGGLTWSYTLDSSTPNTSTGDLTNEFNSVSCSGNTCVAVGESGDSPTYPLIATSNNGGQTWTYTVLNNSSALPSDFSDRGFLYNVSCQGTTCIASGRYNQPLKPLLLSSTDSGVTWVSSIDSQTPTVPTGFTGGLLISGSIAASSLIPESLRFLIGN